MWTNHESTNGPAAKFSPSQSLERYLIQRFHVDEKIRTRKNYPTANSTIPSLNMDSLWLPRTLKGGAIFAVATGILDVCLGISTVSSASDFPVGSTAAARVDSQFRFLGSTWAGYGLMLWWASNDLRSRQVPFAILGAIIVAGGVGRVLSARRYGFGARWMQVAMWAELLGPGVFYMLAQ